MYRPGNDFELIPTLKMETKNLVVGNFGIEFPAVCNHCGVMLASSRKTLAILENFLRFFLEKRDLTVKFSKFYSESFHRDTDRRVVLKFREIRPTGDR